MNPYQPPPPYMYGGYIPGMAPPMVRPPMVGYPPNPYGMPMMPMPMPMPMPQSHVVQAPPKPAVTMPVMKPVVEQTTVYVGKIPPTVEDEFIRKLLEVSVPLNVFI